MPTPTEPAAPTPAQIVDVAEIVQLSVETVETMIAADSDLDISNAKWAKTLEDLDRWPAIRDEAGDTKRVGEIEFFEGKAVDVRLNFINAIRRRYGQSPIGSEFEDANAAALVTTGRWF